MSAFRILTLLLLSLCCSAQTFTVLHTFSGNRDGGAPFGGVAINTDGNLFGTASGGGQYGQGVVYEINPASKELVLHSFFHTEGSQPYDTPLLAAGGNLFVTTTSAAYSSGSVFELFKGGKLGVLHKFGAISGDGAHPSAGVVQDQTGNLYGTTPDGGYGHGTVYKIDPFGVETLLYKFDGSPDGDSPDGGIILGTNGNLYGTTVIGGAMGYGAIYRLDSSGKETILHDFLINDGWAPIGGLVSDPAGNLYGTTYQGGAYFSGVVFKLARGGALTVLHSFGDFSGAPSQPYAGVVRDSAGHLYGTTAGGGAYFSGTVYKLDPSSDTITILHEFTGGPDGGSPYAGVTLDAAGNLYGTTVGGGKGPCYCGVVFKITR